MSLHTLMEVLRGRRRVAVARRTRNGLAAVVTGRLEHQEPGLLVVADDAGAVHRVHLHSGLVIREVA